MRFNLWIANLWPGCLHAWQGEWRGLALAVCFAGALNGAVLSSFGSLHLQVGGLSDPTVAAMSWLLVLGLWSCGLIWVSCGWPKQGQSEIDGEATEQFQQAQHEYLRGHWIEAETLLRQLLRENSADTEAQLLLASVQRRTRQWNEARKTLRVLQEKALAAGKWLMEIAVELVRIDELENDGKAAPDEESAGDGGLLRAA